MIHIMDDYYVDIDDNCYIVGKKKKAMRKNPDTGVQEETEVFKQLHYLGSMHSAVQDIAKMYRKDKLSGKEIELDEAIKIIHTADQDMKSVLYRALGEEK